MRTSNQAEKGNILFYILIAVVLLAALSYVLAKPGGDSAAGSEATRVTENIKSQGQTIRSALQECNLNYGFGYPAQPGSGLAKDIQCQTDSTPTYVGLFTGATGRFMPQPPAPFGDWTYTVNTGTSPPTIAIALTKAMNCTADQGMKSALVDILPLQYSATEMTAVCNGTTASFTLYIVKGS